MVVCSVIPIPLAGPLIAAGALLFGIAAGMVMCCALLAVMANAYRRQVKKERKIEEAAAELVAKQCDEANKRIRDFQAPFACIKASDFVELGRFVQYENLRRRNLLTYVDSVRDDFFQRSLTIFASHQWLGRDDPDPDRIQYRCICAALRDISSRGDRSLDEVYLWLDYASVPQSSRAVQRLMIMSLPCIAATVDVFLVVAPRAIRDLILVSGAPPRPQCLLHREPRLGLRGRGRAGWVDGAAHRDGCWNLSRAVWGQHRGTPNKTANVQVYPARSTSW